MVFLALIELAHRAARAPAGEVGALRFTAVGRDWDHPAAIALKAEDLVVFRSLANVGRAAAITEAGAEALASAGFPLPPRTADLAIARFDAGAPELAEGQTYSTSWLAEAVAAAQPPAAETQPRQLELIPGLRPMRRGPGRPHSGRTRAA